MSRFLLVVLVAILPAGVATAQETSQKFDFQCRSHRLCRLECRDGATNKTIVDIHEVVSVNLTPANGFLVINVEREGEEPHLAAVSNRASCNIWEKCTRGAEGCP